MVSSASKKTPFEMKEKNEAAPSASTLPMSYTFWKMALVATLKLNLLHLWGLLRLLKYSNGLFKTPEV